MKPAAPRPPGTVSGSASVSAKAVAVPMAAPPAAASVSKPPAVAVTSTLFEWVKVAMFDLSRGLTTPIVLHPLIETTRRCSSCTNGSAAEEEEEEEQQQQQQQQQLVRVRIEAEAADGPGDVGGAGRGAEGCQVCCQSHGEGHLHGAAAGNLARSAHFCHKSAI